MRIVFWVVGAVAALFVVLGLLGVGGFVSPDSPDIAREVLDGWYLLQTIYALIVGVLIGALFAVVIARRRLHVRPGDDAESFTNRVVSWAMGASAVASVIWLVVAPVIAALNVRFEPLAPLDRAMLVVDSFRYVSILAAAWLAAQIAFAVATRLRAWSGTYALINL